MTSEFDSEHRARFWQDGFVVERGLATEATVSELRELTDKHLADAVPPLEYEADVAYPGAPVDRAAVGGDTIRRLRGAFDRADALTAWATSDAVTDRVRSLLVSDELSLVRAHHNCVMTKLPRFSSATLWHQDIRYWSYSNNDLVNVWLALGEETQQNGCMHVIPGSHRLQLNRERLDDRQFLRTDHSDNRNLISTAQPILLNAGDVLFFHAGAFHAAGKNQTAERKCAVVFTYHGPQTKPVANTHSAEVLEVWLR